MFDSALGGFEVVAGHAHLKIGLLRLRGPGVHVGRHRARNGGLRAQPHQFVDRFAGDLLQGGARHFERAPGRNLGGRGQVVAGLGVVRIGNGGRAHLEVALGLRELLADGLLPGADQVQVVLRGQHVEIGLGGPRDQVELRPART